ncbi:LOW QUALITY PROTEIN: atrial natriuretic peptide receptor 1-like [Paramacrobiotus metropolitanus]|uniref:LOW QUALITY PROTEIN: atrial natriuretic peptide receptor 1-like n=1 Tax=Paramacrobiotus metropolitanus TaxID=2943436 RepID=UPI002445A198|nr:LOW QUALITY PROTEIN: atrial natriuretic peptide receptor 1-like [Paramacrobiotus metropolitanus]
MAVSSSHGHHHLNHRQPLNCSDVHIEILTLSLMHPFILGSLPYLGPAYDMALEKIGTLYEHLHVEQNFLMDEKYRDCDSFTADAVDMLTAHLYKKSIKYAEDPCALTALIFPGCNEMQEVLNLATELDILMLTSVGSLPNIREKKRYPTWITTTSNSHDPYIQVFIKLARTFKWKSLAVLTDQDANPFFPFFANTLISAFMEERKFQIYPEIHNAKTVDYHKMLLRLNSVSRIYLYFGSPDEFRNLLNNGLINVMQFCCHTESGSRIKLHSRRPCLHDHDAIQINRKPSTLSWQKGDSNDKVIQGAYRSVLIVEPDNMVYGMAKGSQQFALEMINRSRNSYNFTYAPFDRVSPHPASTYAAFLMLAEVVEELRSSGKDYVWASGKLFARRFLNRLFTTDVSEIYIDRKGERIPTINVNQLDWNASQVRTIFTQNASTMELQNVAQPQWPTAWPPANEPMCGFRGDACISASGNFVTTVSAAAATSATLLFLVFIGIFVGIKRRSKYQRFLISACWKVEPECLQPLGEKSHKVMVHIKEQRTVWLSQMGVHHATSGQRFPQSTLSQPVLRILESVLELEHRNVNRLLGMAIVSSNWYFVSEYCARGSLRALLSKTTLELDFQIALLLDTLKGVQAIHRSPIKFHGNLTSDNCLIDKYFTLKIGGVGFQQMRQKYTKELVHSANNDKCYDPVNATASEDIQSVSVILYQIISLEDYPKSPDDLHRLLFKQPDSVSPTFLKVLPDILLCMDPLPENRPEINSLLKSFASGLRPYTNASTNVPLVEKIMRRLETYVNDLDLQVAIRTQALADERKKCEILLKNIFPSSVIEQLRKGTISDAEIFESTTIMFTEIGGFNTILHATKPRTAMMFLNDVYSAFDSTLDLYDVFKVETIRDSYLVASGLPQRNGHRHAKEICTLAMSLFRAYSAFQPLFDGTSLRAGINSGPCAAGVVGHKTPRYCLFGDTVNTASRMLSHGADAQVHVSRSTAELLQEFPEISLEDRGEIAIKGKGAMQTFWLLMG